MKLGLQARGLGVQFSLHVSEHKRLHGYGWIAPEHDINVAIFLHFILWRSPPKLTVSKTLTLTSVRWGRSEFLWKRSMEPLKQLLLHKLVGRDKLAMYHQQFSNTWATYPLDVLDHEKNSLIRYLRVWGWISVCYDLLMILLS
jgi:hypothetical protein